MSPFCGPAVLQRPDVGASILFTIILEENGKRPCRTAMYEKTTLFSSLLGLIGGEAEMTWKEQ
jgi:hypothetical protein